MFALTTLLVFSTVLILECLRRRREHWRYFEKRNIPGPKPHFLWGHYHLLSVDHRYWYERWFKEYGDTFGVFWGHKPMLVTCDLDLQERVLIKEFSNFVDRAPLLGVEMMHPMSRGMLTSEEGTRWKSLRSVITPAFSSGHMKKLTDIINGGVTDFNENIAKQKNNQFDLYPLLRRMTLDTICRTAFGIDANTQSEKAQDLPLLEAAMKCFELSLSSSIDLFANCFESFDTIFGPIVTLLFKFNLLQHSTDVMCRETEKIVRFRRNAPRRRDIMQTLLDSNVVNVSESSFTASGSEEEVTKATDPASKKKTIQLSDDDVVANSVLMILAGYETTSTALAFTFHLLAKNPDVQEKLRQEIVGAIGENDSSDTLYNKVMNLKYLDLCIKESLRRYPPVTGFTTRRATKKIYHKDLQIDAGLSLVFPPNIIQNDPRNFENPESYIPERFTERPGHPLAQQAFGDGPRNCVGMRMALLSMKLTISQTLRNYKLSTNEELDIGTAGFVSQPKKVLLNAEAINS